jgi:hypothetical protein
MAKFLYVIVLVAWFLILTESFVLFAFIIPATPRIHSVGAFTLLGIAKVLMVIGLGLLWFIIIGWLRKEYVKSKLRVKK